MLGIRFIAVNDNYDSLEADTAHDIVVPFKNLINDSYCRDLSVKIRSHLAIKRKNGEFRNVEDLRIRTGIGKNPLNILEENGCFDDLPDTDQVSLFD